MLEAHSSICTEKKIGYNNLKMSNYEHWHIQSNVNSRIWNDLIIESARYVPHRMHQLMISDVKTQSIDCMLAQMLNHSMPGP